MSSILKALKKLEGEKAQRDELSTAVASDILRSSRQKRVRSMSIFIVLLILAAVLCTLAGYFIATSTSKPEVVATPADNRQVVALAAPPTAPVVIDRQAPLSDPGPTVTLPGLSGIVYQTSASDRLAIINDLPVMEGTLVEGFVVRQIYPDKVVVSRDGVDYDLRIRE